MAVPLEGVGWEASIDDVRALVDALNELTGAEFPGDDYFLNLLGTGQLTGRLPASSTHLRGVRCVVVGAYKLRSPRDTALRRIRMERGGQLEKLARLSREIGKARVRDCVDALAVEVRGGIWHWHGGDVNSYEALAQERRAWAHLGATPRDLREEFAETSRAVSDLELNHGGADPAKWCWGEGTPCADVFAADAAKRKYEALKAKLAALQQASSGSGTARERSRSPRQSPAT